MIISATDKTIGVCKNGWNLRVEGSREVYVYHTTSESSYVFVARFKYLKPRTKARAFVKFLVANFTPAEYLEQRDKLISPLVILQSKGFQS